LSEKIVALLIAIKVMMINEFEYHVFYEDQDYGGFYIGSYEGEEAAKKMAEYLWDLFDNRFKQEAIEEFNEILESKMLNQSNSKGLIKLKLIKSNDKNKVGIFFTVTSGLLLFTPNLVG